MLKDRQTRGIFHKDDILLEFNEKLSFPIAETHRHFVTAFEKKVIPQSSSTSSIETTVTSSNQSEGALICETATASKDLIVTAGAASTAMLEKSGQMFS